MIERLEDMPPGTIGFRVKGEVEREDYDDVLTPGLKSVLDAGEKLRALYVIEEVEEMEPGAMWADAKLGFDLTVRHRGDFERSAIVTDINWMVRAMQVFAWMIPGDARVFPMAELADAKAWISAGE